MSFTLKLVKVETILLIRIEIQLHQFCYRTGLWLMYGLSKNDSVIVTVNVIGITLMTAYSALFYVFTYKKSTTLKQILVTVGFLFFTLGYVRVEENSEVLLSRLGKAFLWYFLLNILQLHLGISLLNT